MIVPTMTYEEMLADAQKDLAALYNRCKEPLRKLRKAHYKIGREQVLQHTIEWRSPRGNNWLIRIMYNKRRPSITNMAWYYDGKGRINGIVCSLINDLAITIPPHVIERYGQRCNPLADPLQRLKAFFKENHNYSSKVTGDLGNGKHDLVIGMEQGLGLGDWHQDSAIVHMRTFVSRDMLHKDQQEKLDEMDLERIFSSMTPGQLTEFRNRLNNEIDNLQSGQAA